MKSLENVINVAAPSLKKVSKKINWETVDCCFGDTVVAILSAPTNPVLESQGAPASLQVSVKSLKTLTSHVHRVIPADVVGESP